MSTAILGDLLFWKTADGYQAPDNETRTAADMLEAAGLDWGVELRDLYVPSDEGGFTAGSRQHRKGIVRTDTQDILGVGKSRYNCFTNRDVFAFLDKMVDAGEALYKAAWQWRGGETVGLVMELPTTLRVADFDPHRAYILARTSHDGGGSLTITAQLERLSCTNQVMAKIAHAPRIWRTTHSSSLEGKVVQARQALEMTYAYADAWDEEVQRLLETELTNDRFVEIAEEMFGEKHVDAVADLRATADNLDAIRSTAYGAYNALTDYAQHVQPRRASLESRVTGGIARRTAQAFELVTA